MKQGDTVMIYHDPITKKKPEGKATLRSKVSEDISSEYWKVRFVADGFFTNRWIEKEVTPNGRA